MFENIDTNNLHHAYLIEGNRDNLLPVILKFVESLGVDTTANSDFTHMHFDTLRIDDARDIKALASERGYTDGKKVFLITTNSFLPEAQNTLLKIFEEPIANTHFFLLVPDRHMLLETIISRFYVIDGDASAAPLASVEKFLKMNLPTRLEFIKELLTEEEEQDEEGNEIPPENSARSKALSFLNSLEGGMAKNLENFPPEYFEHIIRVRKFLRMPGSSAKSLMESVALVTPQL